MLSLNKFKEISQIHALSEKSLRDFLVEKIYNWSIARRKTDSYKGLLSNPFFFWLKENHVHNQPTRFEGEVTDVCCPQYLSNKFNIGGLN